MSTYEWFMWNMNGACHIWMSQVTFHVCMILQEKHKYVMLRVNKSCYIWIHHVTYEYVILHMNTSCYIWIRHMLRMNTSWYIWIRHVTYIHVTYEYVMLHMTTSCYIWIRHVTNEYVMLHMNTSCKSQFATCATSHIHRCVYVNGRWVNLYVFSQICSVICTYSHVNVCICNTSEVVCNSSVIYRTWFTCIWGGFG